MLGNEIVEDLAGGGGDGVNVIEITVFGVGDVVVDIDPEGGLGGSVQGVFSQAWLGGTVQGDGDLNVERIGWWSLDLVTARQEGEVVRSAVLVDVVDGFAHLLKGVAEGYLRANGISIGADVAEDDKGVMGADGVGYFFKGIVFTHTDGTCGWRGFKRNWRK